MKAMVLKRLCNLTDNRTPLELMELPVPVPGEGGNFAESLSMRSLPYRTG